MKKSLKVLLTIIGVFLFSLFVFFSKQTSASSNSNEDLNEKEHKGPKGAVEIIMEDIPDELTYNDSITIKTRGNIETKTDLNVEISNGEAEVVLRPSGIPGTTDSFTFTGRDIVQEFEEGAIRKNPNLTITVISTKYVNDDDLEEIENKVEFKTKYVFKDSNISNEQLKVIFNIPNELKSDEEFSISTNRLLKEDERFSIIIDNDWVNKIYSNPLQDRPKTLSIIPIYEDKDKNELDWHINQAYTFLSNQIIDLYNDTIESCPEVSFSVGIDEDIATEGNNKTKIVLVDKEVPNDRLSVLTKEVGEFIISIPNKKDIDFTYNGNTLALEYDDDIDSKITLGDNQPEYISLDCLMNWINNIGLKTEQANDEITISYVTDGHRYKETLLIEKKNFSKVVKEYDRFVNMLAFIIDNDPEVYIEPQYLEDPTDISFDKEYEEDEEVEDDKDALLTNRAFVITIIGIVFGAIIAAIVITTMVAKNKTKQKDE